MFLLFHTLPRLADVLHIIYIPICFYYFIIRRGWRLTAGVIYIPICFYYFSSGSADITYASPIYIPICFYYFFQSWSCCDKSHPYLHSNMFLLFRIWTTNSRLCVRNLHSNMFLLFLHLWDSISWQLKNLHSNMFLLFLAQPRRANRPM